MVAAVCHRNNPGSGVRADHLLVLQWRAAHCKQLPGLIRSHQYMTVFTWKTTGWWATGGVKQHYIYIFSVYRILPWYIVSVSLSPQSDCQIHLQCQVAPPQMEEYLSSIHFHQQASSQLNKFRMYLSVARLLDYSISDEMTKVRRTVINSVLVVHNLNLCIRMRPLHQFAAE